MGDREANRRWAIVAGVALVLAIAVGVLGARYLTPDCEEDGCPEVERLRSYRPPEPPKILDREGELAGQLSGPRRIVVSLDSVPEIVREGYIAVEDRRFRDHGGVDLVGGFRAFFRNLRSGGVEEGASTITMQLARNVFGAEVLDWHPVHRKLAEFRLAREIEDQLTKDQILEMYLNQIYLGDGVYGVETAARHYFGKPVLEVTPREAALLIGLAKNPEGYNPRRNPDRAGERIATVLDVLASQGIISAEDAAEAREDELVLVETTHSEWGANAYYLAAVRRELRDLFPNPATRQGLRVYTGLDPSAQAAAVEALGAQIRRIESGAWGTYRHEVPGDSVAPANGASPYLQGMIVAMEPQSGLVTTLVGGRDYDHSEFDRAFLAERQPGSAFKPFVWAAALGQGMKLSESVSTEPFRFAQRGSDDWEPSDHVSGGEITLRDGLVRSSNTAAARIGSRVGTGRVRRQAESMGITTDIPDYPSIFLGAAEVIPAQLVAAYAAFGNGGMRVTPYLITRIEDANGRIVHRNAEVGGGRALDPATAYLVLDVMKDVVRRGTGYRVGQAGLGVPVAGKTGTTNDGKDVWFVGITPRLVAGVWLGFDTPRTIVSSAAGGTLAAPVWATFMGTAIRGYGSMTDWGEPAGIVRVQVDAESGYRIPADCAAYGPTRTELFLAGTEPFEHCPTPRELYWDRMDQAYADSLGIDMDSSSWRNRRDSTGRTTFYRGETDAERRRREAQLDSLTDEWERRREQARPARDTVRPSDPRPRPRPADTVRIRRDTTRVDTTSARPDTPRRPVIKPAVRDTTPPPDTTRPDTLSAGGGGRR